MKKINECPEVRRRSADCRCFGWEFLSRRRTTSDFRQNTSLNFSGPTSKDAPPTREPGYPIARNCGHLRGCYETCAPSCELSAKSSAAFPVPTDLFPLQVDQPHIICFSSQRRVYAINHNGSPGQIRYARRTRCCETRVKACILCPVCTLPSHMVYRLKQALK